MSPTTPSEKVAAAAHPIGEELMPQNELMNTAKVDGEVFVPGASELIAGNVASGIGHFVASGVAVALLAPTMPILATLAAIGIRANSYSQGTRGAAIWKR